MSDFVEGGQFVEVFGLHGEIALLHALVDLPVEVEHVQVKAMVEVLDGLDCELVVMVASVILFVNVEHVILLGILVVNSEYLLLEGLDVLDDVEALLNWFLLLTDQ